MKYFLSAVDVNIVAHPENTICEFLEGEVNFTCNATGTPYPNITWQKDGKEIVESNSVRIVTDENGHSILTIKNCGRFEALASYRSKATNPPDLEVFSEPAVSFFACKCLLYAKLTTT